MQPSSFFLWSVQAVAQLDRFPRDPGSFPAVSERNSGGSSTIVVSRAC